MLNREFHEPYFIPANDPEFLSHGESWVENNLGSSAIHPGRSVYRVNRVCVTLK